MQRRFLTLDEKRDLARQAMHLAVRVRCETGAGLEHPICAYGVCERRGVVVRFVDVNMEGVYLRQTVPRIFLSTLRPVSRRHFSCAHELGHHLLGHGTGLDQLRNNEDEYTDRDPNEFLADAFAGHFLMPVLGIRTAFSRRRVEPTNAGPSDILAIATEFGVAYEALLTQLAFSFGDITKTQRNQLLRSRSNFRNSLLAEVRGPEVVLIDKYFDAPTLDIEVNHLVVAPHGAVANNDIMRPIGESAYGQIFRAVRRGIGEITILGVQPSVTVRIAPHKIPCLAKFRFLEDDE